MKKFEKYKNWLITFVFIVAILAVYKTFDNFGRVKELLRTISSSLTPFIVGFSVAYILNIPCRTIDNACKKSKIRFINKGSKVISITSVYLLLILIIYICIRAVAPAVYKNIVELYYNIPGYVTELMNAIQNFQIEHNITLFSFDIEGIMATVENMLGKFNLAELSKYAQGVVDVTANVIKIFVGIIVSVYMLIEKDTIKESTKRVMRVFLKEEKSKKVISSANAVNNIFSKYLYSLILVAFIMMIMTTSALSLLKVKYAVFLGIMIGLFNLIPYFGAIIAVVITIVTTLLTGGVVQAFWVAVVLLIIQQIDGNFIGPKVMGDMLDASPLLIIFAVTLGGGLFGILGMIISVPFFIALKMALKQYVIAKETRLENKSKEEKNSEE